MGTRQELLRHLWDQVINAPLRQGAVANIIASCNRDAEGPFEDTGGILQRMLDAGISTGDIAMILRMSAYEAVFAALYSLDAPGVDGDDVLMLHEELLGADPSGMEGRPGSATAV